ncbi:MAG: hexokinase [Bacteroidota bacterium]|nr:hexokinase [Odoribacter sp.]MDP3642280.1 hexokinase [Bacteroidota bacterium]
MINPFALSNKQLLEIANDLKTKIEAGLRKDLTEIKCLPTYIHPKKDGISGEATVFDLGGTNFRAAVVSVGEETKITGMAEKDITEMKMEGFTEDDLYNSQAVTINQLKVPKNSPIGYCFSYPAKSLLNGDAELIVWTKGVNIAGMAGNPIGEPLIKYLNKNTNGSFGKIAVVNDTITSLFAGLMNPGYDAYIGLIVGTGTNMATFFPSEYIPKIKDLEGWSGETPVNLESGNFNPPHLTLIDEEVDANSDNKGFQRFEKAISGMYLGRIFRAVFPNDGLDVNLDAAGLSKMMNNPEQFKLEYVETAFQIYERSAKLVAASLAGLVINLNSAYPSVKKVQVLAEGSLFWSKVKIHDTKYLDIVNATLKELISELGLDTEVQVSHIENANLIGAAMSVLS